MKQWAILGPGSIAHHFARALLEVNGSIAAVGARNPEKGKAFAAEFNIPKAGSFQDVLKDPDIDVVYIATPHAFHYDTVMDALNHGKHVLAEKAITVNERQLQEILDTAAEKDLIVAEAMTIYHMPIYQKLKQLIAIGTIGKVHMINVDFNSIKELNPENRFYNPALAGGAVLDIGVYALSFARLFLDEQPEEILTAANKYQTGVDEQAGILLRSQAGQMAVISLSFRAEAPERAVISGSKGYIEIDKFTRAERAAVFNAESGQTEMIEAGATEDALRYEVEHMNALLNGETDHSTIALTQDVMKLMDNLRKQWGVQYEFE